jgi:hypothetical protein
MHGLPIGFLADHHEIPGLHIADGWRGMGGRQQPMQQVIWHGIGQELVAHVAARVDGAIDRLSLRIGKWTGHREMA